MKSFPGRGLVVAGLLAAGVCAGLFWEYISRQVPAQAIVSPGGAEAAVAEAAEEVALPEPVSTGSKLLEVAALLPRQVLAADTSGGPVVGPDAEDPALRPLAFYARMRTALADADLRGVSASAETAAAEVGRVWQFGLFDELQLSGRVVRAETLESGRASFFGTLEEVPGGDFIATFNGDGLAVSFSTPGQGLYQIRQAGDGRLTVIELDAERHPPCATCVDPTHKHPTDPEQRDARLFAAALTSHAQAQADLAADTSPLGSAYGIVGQQGNDGAGLVFTDIDVMLLHTGAAEAGAGGASGMAALKDHLLARANAVFVNSRVGIRLRIVHSAAVAYSETSNISTDLDRLTLTADGFLDGIHATRTATGADLVTLLTETSGSSTAGLAWLYAGGGASAATNGFNVVLRAGAESTYIHEVGHNFGCRHDRENAGSGSPLYPYSYGHRFTPAGQPQLRTVMAYAPGLRIPYFSNPEVTYLGAATGVAVGQPGEAHNALTLLNTRAAIASFRTPAGNLPPSVTLTAPTSSSVLVANDPLALSATASDTDGSIASVRFYRLTSDNDWNFSNVLSTSLGTDVTAPHTASVAALEAGFHAFAAVAQDNSGATSAHVVPVTVNPWYVASVLAIPSGYYAQVDALTAMNDDGSLVGTLRSTSTGSLRACVWTAGGPVLLEPLAGDVSSTAVGVAPDGRIFGESISGGGGKRAVRWPTGGGSPTDLSGLVGGGVVLATAIGVDEGDRLVSRSTVPSTRSYRATTVLPTNFQAQAVGGASLVVGFDYNFANSRWEAARWTSGTSGTFLPPVAGGGSAWGWAMNRSGGVAGITSPSSGGWSSFNSRATYWPAGSTVPVSLHPAGASASWATGVNDHGEVVGSFDDGEDKAFRWDTLRGTIPLSRVVMPLSSRSMYSAEAINNLGQIAVLAWNQESGGFEPVRLNPVAGMSNAYWQRTHFSLAELAGVGVAGDTDDPDGDLRANLLERAFGLLPERAETQGEAVAGGWPDLRVDTGSGRMLLSFRRQRAPSDLVYSVQASSTLAPGSWSEAGAELVERVALDADWDAVTYRSVAVPAAGAAVFLRVQVSR